MTQSTYFVTKNGEQAGPYTADQIKSMWDSGVLTADALAWDEARQEWLSIGELGRSHWKWEKFKTASQGQPPPIPVLVALAEVQGRAEDPVPTEKPQLQRMISLATLEGECESEGSPSADSAASKCKFSILAELIIGLLLTYILTYTLREAGFFTGTGGRGSRTSPWTWGTAWFLCSLIVFPMWFVVSGLIGKPTGLGGILLGKLFKAENASHPFVTAGLAVFLSGLFIFGFFAFDDPKRYEPQTVNFYPRQPTNVRAQSFPAIEDRMQANAIRAREVAASKYAVVTPPISNPDLKVRWQAYLDSYTEIEDASGLLRRVPVKALLFYHFHPIGEPRSVVVDSVTRNGETYSVLFTLYWKSTLIAQGVTKGEIKADNSDPLKSKDKVVLISTNGQTRQEYKENMDAFWGGFQGGVQLYQYLNQAQ